MSTEMEVDTNDELIEGSKGSDVPRTQAGSVAVRSIEGWIVLVTNVHEEASEEDLMEKFGDYGEVQQLHLNLDRRTGYVKGYALIEYATLSEAKLAIESTNNTKLLDQTIYTEFAFVRPPPNYNSTYNPRGGAGARGGRNRHRSRSPLDGGRGNDRDERDAEPKLEDRIG